MRKLLLFLNFVSQTSFAADFELPKDLQLSDIPIIVQSFSTGFLARVPNSLWGQDQYNTEVNLRVNSIDTKKISKLGQTSKEEEVKVQELSFSKRLPFDVEMGIHSSLFMLDREISTFGGYVRWGFKRYFWGDLSLVGHAASGSYKNVISSNLYGSLLSVDLNLWSTRLSVGTGYLRTTNTFDPSLFGITNLPAAVTYGRMYSHQSVKFSYLWDQFSLNIQGDWIKDFFSSASIAYLF